MSSSSSVRTLILLRHAKADRPAEVSDRDRPLSMRGLADASAAGVWLAEQGHTPELVLCSPARRTRQTWHQAAAGLSSASEIHYAGEIYSGSPEDLLALVQSVAPEISTVLLVGHNPTIEQFAVLLDPENGGRMPTASITIHRQSTPWAEIGPKTAPIVATHIARG